jgi:hypothetical protein
MPLIRCPNGHFYDDEQHASCPWCRHSDAAADGSASAPLLQQVPPPPGAHPASLPPALPPSVRGANNAPEMTYGFAKTEAVFTGRVKSIYDLIVPPDEPEQTSAEMEEPVPGLVTNTFAITGGVCFLMLAALPWFGATDYHSYIYCFMYALCAGLCALSFRYGCVNAAVIACAAVYISFCFLASFTNFDYYPFIMALSVLPLLSKRRAYRVTVAVLEVVFAFILNCRKIYPGAMDRQFLEPGCIR